MDSSYTERQNISLPQKAFASVTFLLPSLFLTPHTQLCTPISVARYVQHYELQHEMKTSPKTGWTIWQLTHSDLTINILFLGKWGYHYILFYSPCPHPPRYLLQKSHCIFHTHTFILLWLLPVLHSPFWQHALLAERKILNELKVQRGSTQV